MGEKKSYKIVEKHFFLSESIKKTDIHKSSAEDNHEFYLLAGKKIPVFVNQSQEETRMLSIL